MQDSLPGNQFTEINPPKVEEVKVEIEPPKVPEVKVEVTPPTTVSPTEAPKEQWQQAVDKVMRFIDTPPDYITNFFNTYKRPLITVGLIVAIFVTIKVLLGLLDAINDLPLIAPTFELIGIGFTAWFIYRYLLAAENRKELVEEINTLKEYVLGKGDSTS
jgi:CAAD domains of cyanobacterial aminoacyl-tRNA synthetase